MSEAEGPQTASAPEMEAARGRGQPTLMQRARWPMMIGVPLLILLAVAFVILTGGKTVATDDAYVQLARVAISPSIPGRVAEVAVHENQPVRKGQVLFRLDPAEYQVAVAQAEAALAAAQQDVKRARAGYGQRQADLSVARESIDYTEREAARQKALAAAGVSTQAQADAAAHAAEMARRQLVTVRQQVASALAEIGGQPDLALDAQPAVLQAKAELDRARLNLSYTTVVAPSDGVVTKVEQLQVGSRVAASQGLFWLVSGAPWIEANFKEDQLAHMRIGQSATIKVDAFDEDLKGRVASFSPGTGSSFSLLPPENATGNWVKVIQRLPVRINLDRPPANLSAGLSAKAIVDIQAARAASRR